MLNYWLNLRRFLHISLLACCLSSCSLAGGLIYYTGSAVVFTTKGLWQISKKTLDYVLSHPSMPMGFDNYGIEAMNKYPGHYKVGKTYTIKGKNYTPKFRPTFTQIGEASWYGPNFHNKVTANGDIFDQRTLTAAHKTLPMPSMIKVTNLQNGRTVKLMVNDRGPFSKERVLDVSYRAAEILGFVGLGHIKVRIDYLPKDTERLLSELGLKRIEGTIAKKRLSYNSQFYKPSRDFILGKK